MDNKDKNLNKYQLHDIICISNLQKLTESFAKSNDVGCFITDFNNNYIIEPVGLPVVCQTIVNSYNFCCKFRQSEFSTPKKKIISCETCGCFCVTFPLFIDNSIVAFWTICQAPHDINYLKILPKIAEISGISITRLEKKIENTTGMSDEKFNEVSSLLQVLIFELSEIWNKNLQLQKEIAEKHITESRLEKSKVNLKALFETSPQVYFLIDREYKIQTYNKRAKDFISTIFQKDLTNSDYIFKYFSKEENEFFSHYIEKCFKGESHSFEKKYEFNGTHSRWYTIHLLPAYNSDQEIFAVSFSLLDITEKKKAEAAIERERNLLLTIINNVPDSIFIKDNQSRFLISNNAVAKLMKTTPEKLYLKTDFDFYPEELAQKFYDDEQYIIKTGKPLFNIQENVNDEDIAERWYNTTKVPIKDNDGNVTGIIGIGHDITDLLKTQSELEKAKIRAENADRLKSAFLANMSHEIRTPMNGIIGFADVLQNENIDKDDANRYLSIIKKNGLHLLGLINDIIDISKIESNQVRLWKKEFSLNDLLFDLYSFFLNDPKIKDSQKLQLLVHYGLPDENSIIFSDETRIKQVITNLLGNAIKFTEEGTIETGYIINQTSNEIEFFVKDTGIGIPISKQEILFSRFRQVDDSASRKYGGSGLGLAISKGLAELLGGKIWFKSEKDQGSEFYFSIPFISVPELKKKISIKESEIIRNFNWQGKKILIVEDDESSFLLLKLLLLKTNVIIIYARNGREAVNLCKDNQDIDVILMDLQMPEINGFDATIEIKKECALIPVIALTSHAQEETQEKCIKFGFDGFLSKPYNEEVLLQTLNEFLNRSKIQV